MSDELNRPCGYSRSGSYLELKPYANFMLYNSTNLYIRGSVLWSDIMDLVTFTAQCYIEEGHSCAICASPALALDLASDETKLVILACALSDIEDLQSLLLLQSSDLVFCLYGEEALDSGVSSSFITLEIQ